MLRLTVYLWHCYRAIEKSNCYHKNGHEANCGSTGIGTNVFMMIFGIAQIFASQIPDFHNMAWLSIVAALMSFGYASIGLGLGFATVIGINSFPSIPPFLSSTQPN